MTLDKSEQENVGQHQSHNEQDFLEGEKLKIELDVYNMTIAGILTKEVSPVHLIYCIKVCFMTFMVQTFLCFFFCYEFLDFNRFQPFYTMQTSLRILCCLLQTQQCYKEFQQSVKMLTFLKRMKATKGRLMNILICSMQIMTPLFALCAMTITMTQQSALSYIVKDFVTIGFILNVDNLFAGTLPGTVKTNA